MVFWHRVLTDHHLYHHLLIQRPMAYATQLAPERGQWMGNSKLVWKPLVGRMQLCHSGWYIRGAAKGDADQDIYHVGEYMKKKWAEYLAWK